ncbi:hypothetical protein SAMN05421823_11811 [Catalinimonas alkaloidigena]|uniref:Uncharacterized protein n=1 Tax=Catalinimonas alkaloidigena TaxID=1075417 RepID=A0A1G9UVT1_9BACT|nr:hypothetical protein [Catalinimonas alkaloidigena]SDM64064.1 hypothetical protein SAMN05421823_11811 [Catalinimonas alkaloidigena]
METTPFFIFLFFHLTGLIIGFGSVITTDLFGLLWIWNRVRFTQVIKVSGITEYFIWAGWALMVAAGVPLLVLKGELDQLMVIKLFFVGLVGLNGLPLHLLHQQLKRFKDGDQVPKLFLFRLILCLSISQLGWWGAVVIGFFHRHIWTIIEWPARPGVMIALFVGSLLLIWVGGEALGRRKRTVSV